MSASTPVLLRKLLRDPNFIHSSEGLLKRGNTSNLTNSSRQACEQDQIREQNQIRVREQTRKQDPSREQKQTSEGSTSSRWLVSPSIDYLFVCGFAPWILGFLTSCFCGPFLPGSPNAHQTTLSILFIVLSFLVGESHQFTSILRNVKKQVRDLKANPRPIKWGFWRTYLRLQVAAILVLMVNPQLSIPNLPVNLFFAPGIVTFWLTMFAAPLALLLFPVVLMHHICAQSRAIGLIYCGGQDFRLSEWENRLLSFTLWMLVLTAASSIAQPFGIFQGFSIAFSAVVPTTATLSVCLVSVVATALMFIVRGVRKGEWLPAPTSCLWLNLALFVLLGTNPAMIYVWLFVPLAFHATQHWAVAWSTQCKERINSEAESKWLQASHLILPVIAITFFVVFSPALLDNCAVFYTGKPLASLLPNGAGIFPIGVGQEHLSLEFSLAVFYLHYFADRVVWKGQHKGSSADAK